MAEYGFMYEGLETGRFRSRLSEIDLRRMDTVLGPQIGPELDTLRAEGGYGRFLERYTTSRSPLAHEAANHLAQRIQLRFANSRSPIERTRLSSATSRSR